MGVADFFVHHFWVMNGDEPSISCVQCSKTRVNWVLSFRYLCTYAQYVSVSTCFLYAKRMHLNFFWIQLKKWNMGLLPLGNSLKKRCSKASKGLLRTYQPPIASSKSHLQLYHHIYNHHYLPITSINHQLSQWTYCRGESFYQRFWSRHGNQVHEPWLVSAGHREARLADNHCPPAKTTDGATFEDQSPK